MELAYSYSAVDAQGKLYRGVVYAGNADLAYSKLRRGGVNPSRLTRRWLASVANLWSDGFEQKDLVRLYRVLGRRLQTGRSMDDGLALAFRFIRDPKLRHAILLMRQAMFDGRREHEALTLAGFPRRDAMVVRAAERSGRTGEMLLSLSEETARRSSLRAGVRSTLRMPLMTGAVMYLFSFGMIRWVTPRTAAFLDNIGASTPGFTQAYFACAKILNEHPAAFISLYALAPMVLFLIARSSHARKMADQIGPLRELSVKTDHACLWAGFSLLYDAAVPPVEAARIMAEAAERADSKLAFNRLERLLQTGMYLDDAVERSSFPPFIVDGIRAAVSGGGVVEGIRDMTGDIIEDVEQLTRSISDHVNIGSILGLSIALVGFFFLSYYPMLSVAMKNV